MPRRTSHCKAVQDQLTATSKAFVVARCNLHQPHPHPFMQTATTSGIECNARKQACPGTLFVLGLSCCKPAGVVRSVDMLQQEYLLLCWLQVDSK